MTREFNKFDGLYMGLAKMTAEMSTARRLKTGAVIVSNHRVLSLGYNGTPPGHDNSCEEEIDGILVTRPEVIHAEQNAIYKLARDGASAVISTMYCTHAPCSECAKAILMSGITTVIYNAKYEAARSGGFDSIKMLTDHGVAVRQYTPGLLDVAKDKA